MTTTPDPAFRAGEAPDLSEALAALGWQPDGTRHRFRYRDGDHVLCLTGQEPVTGVLTRRMPEGQLPPVYLAREVDAVHPGGRGSGVYHRDWIAGVLHSGGTITGGAAAVILDAARHPAETLAAALTAAHRKHTGASGT